MERRKPKPATRPLRRFHRWLGIGAAAFLVLLCVTGVLLNHSSGLGLDTRFVESGWLLDRYGIASPDPGPAFDVGGRWVTLVGTRLYLDDEPVADASALVGAVALDDGQIAAAAPTELLIVSPAAVVAERWPIVAETGAPVTATARAASGVALRTASTVYVFDLADARVRPASAPFDAFDWATPAMPDEALVDAISRDYRGRGLSIERVLADVHSGRLAGLPGVVVMDLAAVALVILALTGIVIWMRR